MLAISSSLAGGLKCYKRFKDWRVRRSELKGLGCQGFLHEVEANQKWIFGSFMIFSGESMVQKADSKDSRENLRASHIST